MEKKTINMNCVCQVFVGNILATGVDMNSQLRLFMCVNSLYEAFQVVSLAHAGCGCWLEPFPKWCQTTPWNLMK